MPARSAPMGSSTSTERRRSCRLLLGAAALGCVLAATLAVPCGAATAPGAPATPGAPQVRVALDASATPIGTIDKDLIGVDGPGPVGAEHALRALGVHFVRTDVSFEGTYRTRPDYDCETGAWDPATLDARVAGIRAEGGTPLEIVDYAPTCLSSAPTSSDPSHAPPDVGADRPKWDALVTRMAVHEIRTEGVRWFEVWNEPDWLFFSGGLTGYLQLYTATAHALDRAAAEVHVAIHVGGPALADVLDTQDTAWLGPFLAYVHAHRLPLAFISWHSYANDPFGGPSEPGAAPICLGRPTGPGANPCYYNPGLSDQTIAKEVDQTRAALAKYPGLHPLLIVDEWNIDGLGDPRQSGPYDAAYAAAVLAGAQRDGLSAMSWFDVADAPTNPDDNWGLLTSSYRPKPVYQAFLDWHAMEPAQLPVTVTPGRGAASNTGTGGGVGAVASTGPTGTITVLLYDFAPYLATGDYGTHGPTPSSTSVTVTITGAPKTAYRGTEDVVAPETGTHTDEFTTSVRSSTIRFSTPHVDDEEVVLLVFKPS